MLHKIFLRRGLSVILFVTAFFGLYFIMTNTAQAATITAVSSGNWHTSSTWAGDVIPGPTDDVIIPTGVVVVVDVTDAEANTLTIQAATTNNGVIINDPGTLTVAGAAVIEAATATADSAINVGSGGAAFTAESLTITGSGTVDENSFLIVNTGTVNITNDVTFAGTAAQAQFTSTGASDINIGGHFGSGGTFARGNSTITFNGSGAQNVGAYDYTNIVINKSGGTATLQGATNILGTLTISDGTLDTSTHDTDFTGLTTISDGGTLSHGTGTKIQNGALIIEEGGTWLETDAAAVTFYGHVTNNGTFTASTGVHTFAQDDRTINGTLLVPSANFTGNYTNNGTFTVTTTFAGTHSLTNAADATLNIGAETVTAGLVASAAGNIVHYNRAGTQTVKIPTGSDYDTLTLGGSGTKTIASGIDIAGDVSIDDGVRADLTGSSTADRLYLDGDLQFVGVWGSNASDAQYKQNGYFAGAGTVTTADGTVPSSNSSSRSGSSQMSREQAKRIWDAYYEKKAASQDDDNDDTSDIPEILDEPTAPVATPVINYAFGNVLVRLGVTGEACLAWQNFLNAKANAGLATDAHCGPLTMDAAKAWQASQGLVVDGLLGPMSRAKAMMQ
jgi:hypothetical protein